MLVSSDQRGTAASYQQLFIIETNNISFVYLFFAYWNYRVFKEGLDMLCLLIGDASGKRITD
jgi:hypothetical protein